MELKQIRAGWKEGRFAPCYLLYGTEPYLLEEYEKRLKQPFEGSFGEMNLSIFERETPLNDVLDAAETLPFFAPKRLVLLRESGLFLDNAKFILLFICPISYIFIISDFVHNSIIF